MTWKKDAIRLTHSMAGLDPAIQGHVRAPIGFRPPCGTPPRPMDRDAPGG
jgi:hypothetical protein